MKKLFLLFLLTVNLQGASAKFIGGVTSTTSITNPDALLMLKADGTTNPPVNQISYSDFLLSTFNRTTPESTYQSLTPVACVTFVFEDGLSFSSKYTNYFFPRGIPACQVVVASALNSGSHWTTANLLTLQGAGWEIINGTSNHTHLQTNTLATLVNITNEVLVTRDYLISLGFDINSFSYPYGEYTNEYYRRIVRSVHPVSMGGYATANEFGIYSEILKAKPLDTAASFTSWSNNVNNAISRQSWQLFYCEVDDDTMTNSVVALIDYCLSNNVRIVTLQQGLAIHHGIIDSYGFNVSAKGDIRANRINTEASITTAGHLIFGDGSFLQSVTRGGFTAPANGNWRLYYADGTTLAQLSLQNIITSNLTVLLNAYVSNLFATNFTISRLFWPSNATAPLPSELGPWGYSLSVSNGHFLTYWSHDGLTLQSFQVPTNTSSSIPAVPPGFTGGWLDTDWNGSVLWAYNDRVYFDESFKITGANAVSSLLTVTGNNGGASLAPTRNTLTGGLIESFKSSIWDGFGAQRLFVTNHSSSSDYIFAGISGSSAGTNMYLGTNTLMDTWCMFEGIGDETSITNCLFSLGFASIATNHAASVGSAVAFHIQGRTNSTLQTVTKSPAGSNFNSLVWTPVTNTPYRFTIVCNTNSSVLFYTNGVLAATHSTFIPFGLGLIPYCFLQQSGSNSSPTTYFTNAFTMDRWKVRE